MSVIGSNILAGASGQGGGYNLTKSLRFRSSATASLSRTPASATNRKTWTWSAWIKRAEISDTERVFFSAGTDGNNFTALEWISSKLYLQNYTSGTQTITNTTAVYRDASAWYHIVFAIDTTQATSANRAKVYVNGVQQDGFSGSPFSLNQEFWINFTYGHRIGARQLSSADAFSEQYMTEINFVDGQALTPSSFGETSTTTGVWIPKKYTGTYGTNGFYLPFTDTTSTSTLGTDFSGNSNTWTVNNISLTAGSTYDSMTDVPTLTSATTANYAVLNPLQFAGTNGNLPSDGNLTVNSNGSGNPTKAFPSTIAASSGKFYAEFTISQTQYIQVAVADVGTWTSTYGGGLLYGSGTVSWDLSQLKYYINSTSSTATGVTGASNDVMQIAFDADTRKVWFGRNNTWNASGDPSAGTGEIGTVAGTGALVFVVRSENMTTYCNFGQRPFAYTPPTGFVALNTTNLSTPTIGATASTTANKYFDATLYTGNGSAATDVQTITNSGSFQPDLVWTKSRSNAVSHHIGDSVRGIDKTLFSNITSAEGTYTYDIHAFNSNGFTVGNDGTQNTSGYTYVGWQWRASNATAVTNTAGSITSTVSANTTAGFSIVTYTGNGSSPVTIGHGLGVTPAMIILKDRDAISSWMVKHQNMSSNTNIFLEGTGGEVTPGNGYIQNLTSSTTFGVINGGGGVANVNTTSNKYVAYCFAPVAGYSAFGSYTGNGSTDGAFIFTGFRPRYLMIKSTSVESWELFDTSRSPYNQAVELLEANSSGAENASSTSAIDILSNGFKQRNTRAATNGSGTTYIYMAFAESPFKFSNAR